jgi:peptidoglycan/LPS O-acetylase OafA/YrhL
VYLGGLTVVNLAAASVVLDVLHQPQRVLETRPMVLIGKLSYGLYLYNFPVRMTVLELWSWPWLMLFQVAVTFALAALSYVLIERPVLWLRDRARR